MAQQTLFTAATPKIGEVEDALRSRGVVSIIGVDEAGRGPLAGPVHAAAFWMELDQELLAELEDLDDSKKLTEERREELFEVLSEVKGAWAIGVSEPAVIDEINILQATFRAMRLAVDEVVAGMGRAPELVLVDGNMIIPDGDWPQQALVKGDARSLAIAAASVLAKVSRDRVMREAHRRWPQYGFHSNKGYGSKAHREAIKEYGPCPLHRRSFAGVLP